MLKVDIRRKKACHFLYRYRRCSLRYKIKPGMCCTRHLVAKGTLYDVCQLRSDSPNSPHRKTARSHEDTFCALMAENRASAALFTYASAHTPTHKKKKKRGTLTESSFWGSLFLFFFFFFKENQEFTKLQKSQQRMDNLEATL